MKIKQGQVYPGVTKHRSNATKVYCGAAVSANDILVATGMQGEFLSVVPADANDITKCRGPFFVADYAAASGEYTPVAIPMKVVTDVDTSTAAQVGEAVYLSAATAGAVTLGAIPTAPADAAGFSLHIRVGRITKVDSSAGAYVLDPGAANGMPLTGTCLGGGDATVTVTGFTAELDDAPVVCGNMGDSNRGAIRALIDSGTLTMTFDGSVDSNDTLVYTVYA